MEAVRELGCLMTIPENRKKNLPYARTLMNEASLLHHADGSRYTGGEQMEYVCTRLFGQMYIPSGEQNYYHNLIDQLQYTKDEYRVLSDTFQYVWDHWQTPKELGKHGLMIFMVSSGTAKTLVERPQTEDDVLKKLYWLQGNLINLKYEAHIVAVKDNEDVKKGLLIEVMLSKEVGILKYLYEKEKNDGDSFFNQPGANDPDILYRECKQLVPILKTFSYEQEACANTIDLLNRTEADLYVDFYPMQQTREIKITTFSIFFPGEKCEQEKLSIPYCCDVFLYRILLPELTKRLQNTGKDR